MATWKILVTDGLDEAGKAILRSKGEMADMPGITPEDLLKVVGEYDALIVRGRTKVTGSRAGFVAVDKDIVTSSVNALLNAVSQILAQRRRAAA